MSYTRPLVRPRFAELLIGLTLVLALVASAMVAAAVDVVVDARPAAAQTGDEECLPDENAGPYGAFIPNGWGDLGFADYIIFDDPMEPGLIQQQFEDPLDPPGVWVTPYQEFKVCYDPELDLWITYFYDPPSSGGGVGVWVPQGSSGSTTWGGFTPPDFVVTVWANDPAFSADYYSCLQAATSFFIPVFYCDVYHGTLPVSPPSAPQAENFPSPASYAALAPCGAPGAAEAATLDFISHDDPANYGGILGDGNGGPSWHQAVSDAEAAYNAAALSLPGWLLANATTLASHEPDFLTAYEAIADALELEMRGAPVPEPFAADGATAIGQMVLDLDREWGSESAAFFGRWQVNATAATGALPPEAADPLARAVVYWNSGDTGTGWSPQQIMELAVAFCGASATIDYVDQFGPLSVALDDALGNLIHSNQSFETWVDYVWCENEFRPTVPGAQPPKGGEDATLLPASDGVAAGGGTAGGGGTTGGGVAGGGTVGSGTVGSGTVGGGVAAGGTATFAPSSLGKGDQGPVLVAPTDGTIQACFDIRELYNGSGMFHAIEWVGPDNSWATTQWWSTNANHPDFSSGTVLLKFLTTPAMDAFAAAIQNATPDEVDALVTAAVYGLNPNQAGQYVEPTARPILSNGIRTQLTTQGEVREILLQLFRDFLVTEPGAAIIEEVPFGPDVLLGPPEVYFLNLAKGFTVESNVGLDDHVALYFPFYQNKDVVVPVGYGRLRSLIGHPEMSGEMLSVRDSLFDWIRTYRHEGAHLTQHHSGSLSGFSSERGAFGIAAKDPAQQSLIDQFWKRNIEAPAYRVWGPESSCAAYQCDDTSIHTYGIGDIVLLPALAGGDVVGHPLHFTSPVFNQPTAWISRKEANFIAASSGAWSQWFLNHLY